MWSFHFIKIKGDGYIMEDNKKLIGELRLGLDSLKKDINNANKVLEDLKKIKLDVINIEDGKKAIKLVEDIGKELKKINTQTDIKFDISFIDAMKTKISSFTKENTKMINQTVRDADGVVQSYRKIEEAINRTTGRKYQVITNQDSAGSTISTTTTETNDIEKQRVAREKNTTAIYKEFDALDAYKLKFQNDINKLFTNDLVPKDKILKLEEELNNLHIGSDKTDIQKVETVYKNLLDEQSKLNSLKKEELSTRKQSISEGLKEIDNAKKELELQEKLTLAELKQYTQQQANEKYVSGILPTKTLSETLNNISGTKNQVLGSGDARAKGFMDRFDVAKDYVVSSKVFNTMFNSVNEAYDSIVKYESGLVDLSRTLNNVTDKDLKDFGQAAIKASKDFGVPLEDVQNAYTELARAGVDNKSDLDSMVKTVLTGINTTEISNATEMTGYLVSTVKQLGLEFKDSEKIIDGWNMLADKYAVKSNDFAEAIQKSGSSSKALGLTLDNVNAMVVVLGEATQKSGSEVGNALKTMENNMLRPETIKTMESLGISVMKDAEHFNSFQDIMGQVNVKLDEFGDGSLKANSLLDALGGSWRKNDISVLAKGWEQIDKLSKESLSSSGYSVNENAKAMNTLEKQVESLKNSFKELFISFGESGILQHLKSLVNSSNDVVNVFSKIPNSMKNFLLILTEVSVALKTLSAGLNLISGQNLKQFIDETLSKVGLFSNKFGEGNATMRAFGASVKSLTNDLSQGKISVSEFATMSGEIGKQMGLNKTSMNLYSVAEKELNAQFNAGNITKETVNAKLAELSTNLKGAKTTTEAFTSSQTALNAANWNAVKSTLMLNAAMAGISLLIAGAFKLADALIVTEKEQKQMNETFKNAADEIDRKSESTNSLITEYDNLAKKTNKTTEESKRFAEVVKELNKVLPDSKKIIEDETVSIDERTKALKRSEAQQKITALKSTINDSGSKYDKEISSINEYEKRIKDVKATLDILKNENVALPDQFNGQNRESLKKDYQDALDKLNEKLNTSKETVNNLNLSFKALGLSMADSLGMSEQQTDIFNKSLENMIKKGVSKDTIMNSINSLDNLTGEDIFKTLSSSMDTFNKISKPTEEQIKNQKSSIDTLSNSAKDLNLPTDEYKLFIEILDSAKSSLDKNANAIEKVKISNKSFADVEKETMKAIKDNRDEMKAANEILESHAKTGEWDAEAIMKLADSYPDLLNALGDDKRLTEELGKVKEDLNKKAFGAVDAEIQATLAKITPYLNDVQNYADAESAKTAIASAEIAKRIDKYQAELDSMNAIMDASPNEAANMGWDYANSSRALATSKKELEDTKINIEKYFNLQDLKKRASTVFSQVGSKNYDGTKNKGESEKDVTSLTEAESKYTDVIKEQNAILEQKERNLKLLNNALSIAKDKNDFSAQLIIENKILDENNSKLYDSSLALEKYMSTKDNIKQAFYDKGFVSQGTDLSSFTESDFNKIYDKKFAGNRNFGVGDQADKDKEAFEAEKNTFKDLVSQWFEMGTAVDSVKDKMDEAKQSIYETGVSIKDINKAWDTSKIDWFNSELNKALDDIAVKAEDIDLADKLWNGGDVEANLLYTGKKMDNTSNKVKIYEEYLTWLKNTTMASDGSQTKFAETIKAVESALKKTKGEVADYGKQLEDLAKDKIKTLIEAEKKAEENKLDVAQNNELVAVKKREKEATERLKDVEQEVSDITSDTYDKDIESFSTYLKGIDSEIAKIKEKASVEQESAVKTAMLKEASILEDKRAYEVSRNNIQSQIDGYQATIDALNKQADAQYEVNTRLEKQNNLTKLQTELENIKNNKNVQTLKKQSNGSYQFEYTYDVDSYDSKYKELQDATTEYNDWETDTARKHQIEALELAKETKEKELKILENNFQEQQTIAQREYSKLADKVNAYFDDLQNNINVKYIGLHADLEAKYLDIDKLTTERLLALKDTFNGNLDLILTDVTNKTASINAQIAAMTAALAKAQAMSSAVTGGSSSSSSNSVNSSSASAVSAAASISTRLASADVGGMTSDWDNGDTGNGKIMKVHPNELISNPLDTKTLLKTMEISKSLLSDFTTSVPMTKIPTGLTSIPTSAIITNIPNSNQPIINHYTFGDLTLPNVTNGEDFTKDLKDLAFYAKSH
jgi:TP901 family phage tail tape measure protein